MKLCYNVAALEKSVEKAFGHKDLSKLTKKQITDKNGHRRNVYVKNGEEEKKKQGGKPEESNASKDGRFFVGDIVSFVAYGQIRQGKVLGGKGDKVQISGIGDSSGFRYDVNVSDVKQKRLSADGTIPASSFNANDYKKSFTDPKATNTAEGYQYIYESLGETGREAAAITIKRLDEQTKRIHKYGETADRYKDAKGNYTPVRQKLHDKIINKILSPEKIANCKPANGEKPKFVMFGGRGGSGKSWFTDKERAKKEGCEVMFNTDNFLVLDADELKKELPEFEGWNAGEVHEESSELNKVIKKKALELGLNVIIDGTMNYSKDNPDKTRNEMLAAKNMGYSCEAHYMFLPVQESTKRAINRFKTKKGDYTGRLVPMQILLGMQDNEKAFDSVKDIVDDWSFRDNQGDTGPKLISKKGLN